MKTTNLLLAVLCLAGLTAPVAAQGVKKALPEAARAITQKAPVRLQGTKRFVFPKQFNTTWGPRNLSQLNAAVQRNIAQAEAVAAGEASLPPLPAFAVLSQGQAEKTFLELSARERAFYQQETTEAFNLLSQVKTWNKLQTQNLEVPENLVTDVAGAITRIKNDFLRNMVLSLLEDGNLDALQLELSQYYSLGMPFEEAAFNYTLRHPYKRNLQTIRLLHNPFIADQFKEPVQDFITRPMITMADKEAFKTALQNLQAEYDRVLQGAANTPAIQAQINYYEKTINELHSFIQKNGRLPKWNTRSTAEQDLHNRVEYLITVEKQYNYEPFAEYNQTLHEMVKAHQPTYLSKQETLQMFEKFVQITGRLYPRSLQDKGNIPWDEEQLFDNLMYWRTQDESGVNKAIHDIQIRHASPSNPIYE